MNSNKNKKKKKVKFKRGKRHELFSLSRKIQISSGKKSVSETGRECCDSCEVSFCNYIF